MTSDLDAAHQDPLPHGRDSSPSITASPGTTITIDVGPHVPCVQVTNDTTGETTSIPAAKDRATPICIPAVAGGTVLFLTIGKGLDARIVIVEVVDSAP